MSQVIARASANQASASDPAASAFVSANAGTGKTKLLTDRVLRLLLAGAPADSILCVTYTRTAAAEMRNRIFKQLAKWATISASDLGKDLEKMGIATPSQALWRRARSLFAEILDNDDGPRVETVHSFCQSILRRFPIEAGIAPHVQLVEDDEQQRLKAMARANILASPSPELGRAVMLIAEASSEANVEEILNNFITKDLGFEESDCLARVEAHFRDDLGAVDTASNRAVISTVLAQIDDEKLRAVASVLQISDVEDHIKRGAKMDVFLAQGQANRIKKWSFLSDALFSAGKPRSRLSNAKMRKVLPDMDVIQKQIITLIKPLLLDEAVHLCRDRTLSLYQFAIELYREYTRLKAQRGFLDYNDLILRTNNLLAVSEAAQWVAWKLDNGIQHLLIDEAQDTSPAQWTLLRRLTEEFFDGDGAALQRFGKPESPERTIFAVGDFKQSIYSFQGADPFVMSANREDLSKRASAAKADFRDVPLSVSFRSASPILDLVNAAIPMLDGIDDFSTHEVARNGAGGFVELWPVVKGDNDNIVEVMAANRLAQKVKSWIGSRRLPSGKLVGAGDILILLRKRGKFFELLLSALQTENVQVAGADRMKLAEQIEIQDLLALGDVMHLGADDLQLAAVLKSPLFDITEDQLFTLAHDRGNASLLTRLMRHRGANSVIGKMANQLARWQDRAAAESVFGFFSFVLVDGGRERFRYRLGRAVDESLDHYLNLAQNFALGGGVSLLEFLNLVRNGGGEVKRDMDSSGTDEVRVMTIHGAKGLEAPIVILPDLLTPRNNHNSVLPASDGKVHYWLPPSGFVRPNFIEKALETDALLRIRESNRLLYVALTRARDGLVIGGWEKGHGVRKFDGSDYAHLCDKISVMPAAQTCDDGTILVTAVQTMVAVDDSKDTPKLPPKKPVQDFTDWLWRKTSINQNLGRPIQPSQPGLNHVPQSISSDCRAGNMGGHQLAGHFQSFGLVYGRLAHRLLEQLPLISPLQQQECAQRIAGQYYDLPEASRDSLVQKVLALIKLPEFSLLFTRDALIEVPINGELNGIGIAGKIDRLYVDETRIILADFKTGQPHAGHVPSGYLRQMSLYYGLLREIYPGRDIECWLIWVDELSHQVIEREAIDEALSAIFASHRAAS
ncbi:double-strand break repair helicase AddA [Candidatus Puniceispirillum sp.]|nr:double-strand break repair helicase AddA [Candidatus Puniceispirillum sp.]